MIQAKLPFEPRRPQTPPSQQFQPVDLVFVRHPRAKRYVIRVGPNGTVRATIPRGGSKREALAFVERERGWIAAELARAAAARQDVPAADRQDEEEEPLRRRAKHELPVRLLELAAELGLTVSRVSVRNPRWRWGSCSRTGHICLNWRLIRLPPWVRDYVLIHELMHLKRLDHSRAFWKLVAAARPAYQDARSFLRSCRTRPEHAWGDRDADPTTGTAHLSPAITER